MNWLVWFFILSTAILLALYIRERLANRLIHKDLHYLCQKIDAILQQPITRSGERLLIVTNDPALRDVLRTMNELLDFARKAASDYAGSERAMKMMLSNMSHDLKTPLTVILGYAEILQRKDDLPSEERQRLLSRVHRKTVEVNEMIKAFFDLAKIEDDDYEIPLSKVDAGEICRLRILSYYELLAERSFEVDIQIPSEPMWVYGNEDALSRIVDNLLSNAVRYGADGHYIGLSAAIDGDTVQIKVTDHGRGIAAAEQGKIFDRMYTMENSRNRNRQGSGLGLAIAKRLTERIGGQISLTSVPSSFTCFTVTLPISGKLTNISS